MATIAFIPTISFTMLLASAAPLVTFLTPLVIGTIFGCSIDEAASHPCMVLGIDIAPQLATVALSTIFAIPTVVLAPIGLLLIAVHAVAKWLHRG